MCLIHSVEYRGATGPRPCTHTPLCCPEWWGLGRTVSSGLFAFLSDHGLLGQNVHKVTKTISESGPVPGRQQVLRRAFEWVERPPALWVGLSPGRLHILPLSLLPAPPPPGLRPVTLEAVWVLGTDGPVPSPSHPMAPMDGSYRAEPRAASP